MKVNLVTLFVFLSQILVSNQAFSQRYCIDCNPVTLQGLVDIAKTPEDSLWALVAILDNSADNEDRKYFISSVNKLVALNNRLKIIDTTPYQLFRDGLILWDKKRKLASIENIKLSIKAFDRQKKIMGSNSILNSVRIYFNYAEMQEEKLKYYEEKLNYYTLNGPIKNTATCYHGMAGYYYTKADYNNAIKYYLKSAEVFKPFSLIGYSNELVVVGFSYHEWGNFEKAEYYLKAGYPLCIEAGSWDNAIFANTALSILDKKRKNYNEALRKINESLDMYSKHRVLQFNRGILLVEKGDLLIEMNELEEAKKVLQAATAFNDSFPMAISTTSGDFQLNYYWSKYYQAIGDKINAEKNLLTAYQKASNLKSDALVIKYSDALVTFYSESGEHSKALPFALIYKNKKDSLIEIQNANNVSDYEREQKDFAAFKELQRQKLMRNGFFFGFLIVLLFAFIFFSQRNKIRAGKRHSDELLLNILPGEVAEELKAKGKAEAKNFEEVTVLFTDFKNFTYMSERLSAQELVNEINYCYSEFDRIISKYGIEKIKTIGDSYMCAGGLPVPNKTNAVDTVRAALDIRDFMLAEKEKRMKENRIFFETRIGLHTGPAVAGIVGIKKFAYDIWGDTVNIAARMESSGEPGKVNISGTTYELVKDKFSCTYHGKCEAKNKGMIDMYFVNLQTDSVPATGTETETDA